MAQQKHKDEAEPKLVRQLRLLVTGLTITMIVGLVVIVTLLFFAFQNILNKDDAISATNVTLPDGQTAQAVTFGSGWIAVVTSDSDGQDRVLILDPDGQTLRQSIDIN